MSFDTLGLSAPILKAVASQGYDTPSPIQEKAIPAVLAGNDIMAAAQTGTGKTAGFTLPILELLSRGRRAGPNQARTLILTPTRELAAQVGESVALYSKHLNMTSTVVFGGVKINPQMLKLRRGVDILVATPGRLMDLHSQNAVKFDNLEILVLDEADRMLDMGFIHDIKRIIDLLPRRRQNLLFSATFSDDIRKLAKGLVRNPIEISVSPRNQAAPSVEQWVYTVDKKQKAPLLTQLLKRVTGLRRWYLPKPNMVPISLPSIWNLRALLPRRFMAIKARAQEPKHWRVLKLARFVFSWQPILLPAAWTLNSCLRWLTLICPMSLKTMYTVLAAPVEQGPQVLRFRL